MNFKLITPTDLLVAQFNDYWFKDSKEINNWEVKLFGNLDTKVDIREYTVSNPYEKYGKNDKEIRKLYKNNKIPEFLRRINAVYHTRIETSKLYNEIDKKWLDNNNVDALVKYALIRLV